MDTKESRIIAFTGLVFFIFFGYAFAGWAFQNILNRTDVMFFNSLVSGLIFGMVVTWFISFSQDDDGMNGDTSGI